MLPSLSIDRRSIGLGLASTVRAVLELVAPPAPARSGPPLDVVIVLDPTFTAGVDPLVAAAEAAADVLRVARPVDRIGVVAVDHDVVQVLPLGHHDPELATRAIRAWRTDRPGTADGGRAIAAGLLAAAERDGADQRVVVLTDSGPAARLAALFGSVPSARGVMVTVRVSPAVARLHLLDPLPRAATMGAASDDQVEVALGDMFGGETRRLVLALDTHPARSEGLLDLGEARVHWAGTGVDRAAYTVAVPLSVEVHVAGDVPF